MRNGVVLTVFGGGPEGVHGGSGGSGGSGDSIRDPLDAAISLNGTVESLLYLYFFSVPAL